MTDWRDASWDASGRGQGSDRILKPTPRKTFPKRKERPLIFFFFHSVGTECLPTPEELFEDLWVPRSAWFPEGRPCFWERRSPKGQGLNYHLERPLTHSRPESTPDRLLSPGRPRHGGAGRG